MECNSGRVSTKNVMLNRLKIAKFFVVARKLLIYACVRIIQNSMSASRLQKHNFDSYWNEQFDVQLNFTLWNELIVIFAHPFIFQFTLIIINKWKFYPSFYSQNEQIQVRVFLTKCLFATLNWVFSKMKSNGFPI